MSAVPPSPGPDPDPAPGPRAEASDRRRTLRTLPPEDFFGRQPTSTSRLPDPAQLVENLARSVLEVLSGARDIEQIARWMDEDVYRNLLRRAMLASRGRAARRAPVGRPLVQIAATRITAPADGVVEAVVIVHGRARTRAVAIRLQGLDGRWRATAIHVL